MLVFLIFLWEFKSKLTSYFFITQRELLIGVYIFMFCSEIYLGIFNEIFPLKRSKKNQKT